MSKQDFEEKVLQALSELSTDTRGLKADVGALKAETAGLKADVGGIKQDIRRLEVLHEETSEKIDQIIEIVSPELEKSNKHAAQLDDHENRLRLLESTS